MTPDDFTGADWPGPIDLAGLRELIKPFGLTERQLNLLVTCSANGNNVHKAALAAGYSGRSARSRASQLLSNPKVQRALAAIAEAQGIRLDILHARLLQSHHGRLTRSGAGPVGCQRWLARLLKHYYRHAA